ncbi:MAG: NAD/NADP octopine/nopaline dehydrogenase family protein, partial [Gemmataceae bacterium]
HGRAVVSAVRQQGGLHVDRPDVAGAFVGLRPTDVGHDVERLVRTSDLILLTTPSIYHEEAARELAPVVRRLRRPVPLVLSPSRCLAAPYLWRVLGDDYPLVSFQTCPYACKVFKPGSVFIKRRKQSWVACAEGRVRRGSLAALRSIFPETVFTRTPAATSLGNIGAVFHPTAYLLNLPAIRRAEAEGRAFSFYMEGIAHNPEVGAVVEEVDQIRLRIAAAVGVPVFGLRDEPREGEWRTLMARVNGTQGRERAALMRPIHDAVVSGQHWLHYTYGVERVPGESLPAAIARTPNYQANSCPQRRYADEDVATGLVPLEALARRLGVPCGPITRVIDVYSREVGSDARAAGRNLDDFDLDYLAGYLQGGLRCLAPVS